jgi:hypothetical protein
MIGMAGYRVFFFNGEDHILSHEEFFAESDADALARAVALFENKIEYVVFELWQEKRRLNRQIRQGK